MSGPPFSALEPAVPRFLSDVIVELGFAEREAVEQAVRAARSPGTTVERVLVESGALTDEQLARAIAERYAIDYIELGSFKVDPEAANLIEPAAARRYQAVPVGVVDGRLLVALADPPGALGLSDIAAMTGMDVKAAVASRPALDALLGALPLEGAGDPVLLDGPTTPEPTVDPLREELVAVKAELSGRLERLEQRLAEAERSAVAAERALEGLRAALGTPASVSED